MGGGTRPYRFVNSIATVFAVTQLPLSSLNPRGPLLQGGVRVARAFSDDQLEAGYLDAVKEARAAIFKSGPPP